MRIALLSVHGDPALQAGGKDAGGMNIYVREVAQRLQNQGIQVDIYTRKHDRINEIEDSFINMNLVYIEAGSISAQKVGIYSHLEEFANNVVTYANSNNLNYDLIYAHYWLSGVAAIELKKLWKIPIVTSFHTIQEIKQESFPYNPDDPERARQERLVSDNSDAIVVWSKHEKNFIIDHFNIDPKKLIIIPPGVDIEIFRPMNKLKARKYLNINAKSKIMLFVGRLERLKGLDVLLEAISMIDNQDTNLLVVGGTYNIEEVTRLKNISSSLGLTNKVHFIGAVNRNELKYYYNSADLCVLPSYYESFGLAALEAAACGRPVIASKKGGLSSIVRDKVTGYLLQWRCPGPFVEKIEILLNNNELRTSMGLQARKHSEKLTWDSSIQSLKILFIKLTSS